VDSGDPDNRDVKKKILIGKRSVGTLDIMSDSIINSTDADILFYNTKPDNVSQDSTKISFLAGTFSNLFASAPFIESVSDGSSITLNIENLQNSINILSLTSSVTINNISFPTVDESISDSAVGKILKYSGIFPYGKLVWGDITTDDTIIGSTGSNTNIYGSTVSLNGYPLEFIEDRLVPTTIGGIEQGMSFSAGSFINNLGSASNWPLVEIIRNILYPYIEPELLISVINLDTNNKIY